VSKHLGDVLLFYVRQGGFLQRLFSMFPGGWPGTGLLLLRLVAGLLLLHDGIGGSVTTPQQAWLRLQAVAACAGIFLLAGLWTPIAGVLVTLTELGIAFTGTDHLRSTILLATMGIALAILGPGALSIDARLFGRKRLDI
jgi:putative oxidoreductase